MSDFRIRQAARLIRSGGILAYPTEAVFGLGCHPLAPIAVHRLLGLKGRSPDMGLILIAADFSQLSPYVQSLSAQQMQAVFESWPGPYTWLLPASDSCPPWLTGTNDTLAVRVTAHPVASSLCRRARTALVSTSANHSGEAPARSALQARLRFGQQLDMVLSGKTDETIKPTSIRDARTGKLLRAG